MNKAQMTKIENFARDRKVTITEQDIKTMDLVICGIEKGAKLIKKAGKAYSDAILKKPELIELYAKVYPHVPERAWELLDMVGRDLLDGRLVYCDRRTVNILSRVPIKDQRKYIEQGVDVKVKGGVRRTSLVDMSPSRVLQVFTNTGKVLPVEKQKIAVEPFTREPATPAPRPTGEYKIMRTRIIVYRQDGTYYDIPKDEIMKIMG